MVKKKNPIKVEGTVKIDDHEFIGTMDTNQLLRIVTDPRRVVDAGSRAADASLQAIYEVRAKVQRGFEGAKAENVEPYANYICALFEGKDGITPAITLWTADELQASRGEDGLLLEIPWSTELVAIDGETQLAARFEARAKNPQTGDMTVDVKFCYNRSADWARQAFHDLNVFAIRPNAATAVAMDMRDPLTHITRAISEMPFFQNRIRTERQLSKKDKGIATLSVLRSSIVCFAEGIGGIRYGNKSVPVAAERLPDIKETAVEYYTALVENFGPAMDDRLKTVIATPAVLAALGAMGHQLVELPVGERPTRIAAILETLKDVNWNRGVRWEGVCGKVRPNGVFSTAGGVKDSAGPSYRALVDPSNPFFYKVRDRKPPEPTEPLAAPQVAPDVAPRVIPPQVTQQPGAEHVV